MNKAERNSQWLIFFLDLCCLPQLFSCEKDPSFHGENSYYLLSNYTISDDMLRTLHEHPCVILFSCLRDKYYYNLLWRETKQKLWVFKYLIHCIAKSRVGVETLLFFWCYSENPWVFYVKFCWWGSKACAVWS